MKFKVFFINLKENNSNWLKIKNMFSLMPKEIERSLQKIEAIDTRQGISVVEKFGLKLDPVGLVNKLYFSQSPGAVGCFLSHIKAWQSMVEQDLDFSLILEEDIVISDVINFLMTNPDLSKSNDIVNINGRNYPQHSMLNLEGSEAYILSKNGAKKLINLVLDPSPLSKIKKLGSSTPRSNSKIVKGSSSEELNFNKTKSIVAPLDKFLGYCCHESVRQNARLKYKYKPMVDLCSLASEYSTVTDCKKMYYDMTDDELNDFMNSESYCYWKKNYQTSLCICTYNNYERLYKTLKHLEKQLNKKKSVKEIIVIDNTLDAEIKNNLQNKNYIEKIKNLFDKYNLFKYIRYGNACLSAARNKCIELSSSDLVYFIDDDAEINLKSIDVCSEQFNKNINLSVVGGKVLSVWEEGKPDWLKDSALHYFSHVDHGNKPFLLNNQPHKWLVGANICFKKSSLIEHGGFNEDLGRKGSILLSGEEDELIQKIISSGKFVMYHPESKVNHFIPKERCSGDWMIRRMCWQELTNILFLNKKVFDKNLLEEKFSEIFEDKYNPYEKGLICASLINYLLQGEK